MSTVHLLTPLGVALLLLSLAATDVVAEPKEIGRFNDWTAFVDGADAKKVCYVGSPPKKAEGNYTRRGPAYLLVTHRPAEKVVSEVSVEAGYPFKPDSEVTATIDGRAFTLFTQGGNAWARDARADRAMVLAMRSGSEMVVKGVSSRGTETTDTYSLSGFTAAHNAINKACGIE